MLDSYPKLKNFLHYTLIHPYSARVRLWARIFVTPFFTKKGKGAIIRHNARLDIIPSKKFVVGSRAVIENYVIVNNQMGDVIIGDNSLISCRVTIVGPVTIGNDVILGSNTLIVGLTHNYEDPDVPIPRQGVSTVATTVEDSVWIGANTSIMQGVRIGKHSLIGAGSVVTRDIPSYSVAVGNPARVVRKYNFETKRWERVPKTDKA